MATLEGTIQNVHGHTTVGGPLYNGSGNQVMECVIGVTFSGTYVQADNATVLAVPTYIQNSRRDGKTVTLRDASFAHPGDESGTVIGAKTVAVSTADLTLELTGSDLSTEHAGATLSAMTRPIGFRVTYVLS